MSTITQEISAEEIVRRAHDLVPALAERAQECEALRRMPDATIEAFRQGGLFRMVQPAQWGGLELPLGTVIDAVGEVGRGCGSSAWCLTILAVHNWFIGLFPQQAQADVFADHPEAILAAVFYPGGTATPVDDGFRLSGRWSFASGCDHGDWIALGAHVQSDDSDDMPDMRSFLVPRSDFAIIDDWHVAGLRGTGSKSVTVSDVFVPAHRVLPMMAAAMGVAPGSAVNTAPLYRLPFGGVLALVLAAPALGIAQGALETFRERARSRVRAYALSDASEAHNTLIQMRLAEATCEIDAAHLLVQREVTEMTRRTEAGEETPLEVRARFRLSAAYATELCKRAVNRLYAAAGGGAVYDTSPLQRAVRDLGTIGAHVALSLDGAGECYGAVDLGLPPTSMLI